ncbi:sulfotransferase [Magnetococcus sp. PR-3]|uniref:sulfotransferase n=1 Tax=Magnetococcus sp. PR-3 TaxID=3120355 RepID=UPI002FCE09FA
MPSQAPSPKLSVIVLIYKMERELPRTLYTLTPAYQQGMQAEEYEVLVIDNGSPVRRDPAEVTQFGSNFSYHYIEDALPSPAESINWAIEQAQGPYITLCYDGARMLSPGLLHKSLQACQGHAQPVVATLAWHLGPDTQFRSMAYGYNKKMEDELLARIDWRQDGYRLFDISSLDRSNENGWMGPLAESSIMTMHRSTFLAFGGANPGFAMPSGGLLNLDLYKEAIELPNSTHIILLGEGSFHQLHGAVFNNATEAEIVEKTARAEREYEQVRGTPYQLPKHDPNYVGNIPPELHRFMEPTRLDLQQLHATVHACDTRYRETLEKLQQGLNQGRRRFKGLAPLLGMDIWNRKWVGKRLEEHHHAQVENSRIMLQTLIEPATVAKKRLRPIQFPFYEEEQQVAETQAILDPRFIEAAKRPLFLVGSARSGTSYTAQRLHTLDSLVHVPFELKDIWSTVGKVPMGSQRTRDITCPCMEAEDQWPGQAEALHAAFAQRMAQHAEDIRPEGPLTFLNKSPHLCNKLGLVDALFPNARYIWISRPLPQVVASLVALFEELHPKEDMHHIWPPAPSTGKPRCYEVMFGGHNTQHMPADRIFPGGNPRHLAEYWLESNEAVNRFFATLPEDRRCVIRHEQMLSDPDTLWQKLVTFVGGDTQAPNMLARDLDNRNALWKNRLKAHEIVDLEQFAQQHWARIRAVWPHLGDDWRELFHA